MKKIVNLILNSLSENIAYAHCDIPCGIYDPYLAQRAAHTIIRMTQLLTEVNLEDDLKSKHAIARITNVKEEHSNLLEEELNTLRNDYFKDEHYTQYSNLNELFIQAFKFSTKARQNIDMESAQETLLKVQEIAEIFFKTKNVESIRVKSIYPTDGEIVLHR